MTGSASAPHDRAASRSRTVDVTASGLAYSRRGSGPTVLLLHGWCLNRALWMYQEVALSASFEVICPDLPGFGDSAGLAGPYTLERYADAVTTLIDELAINRVQVGGFAFGAAVAMAAVRGGESRIASLALIAPPSGSCAPYEKMPRAMRRDWPRFAQLSAEAVVKQPHSEAEMRWLHEMFRGTPLPVAISTAALLQAFEPADALDEIMVPTLLIHGEQDDVVPVSVSRTCAAGLAHATLTVVPEAGHLVLLDQKEATNGLLGDFFAANADA
jgi:3-oxoadipate enol-lactonase